MDLVESQKHGFYHFYHIFREICHFTELWKIRPCPGSPLFELQKSNSYNEIVKNFNGAPSADSEIQKLSSSFA